MSEHLLHAEDAILRYLGGGRAEFIGTLVNELKNETTQESSLRAAVWILAGDGRVIIDRDMNAALVTSDREPEPVPV